MLDAAWAVLQEKGCEAATVNDIIALSGGSRTTLYKAFGGKDGLFEAAVKERCADFGESMQMMLDERSDPHAALTALATAFLEKMHLPESLRVMAIFCAEGGRFPQLIEVFLQHGPRQLGGRIARYLEQAAREGKLRVQDPELSADMFLSMLQGQWVYRIVPHLLPQPSREELLHRAEATVTIFLDGILQPSPDSALSK